MRKSWKDNSTYLQGLGKGKDTSNQHLKVGRGQTEEHCECSGVIDELLSFPQSLKFHYISWVSRPCNPSIREAEVKGLEAQGDLGPCSKAVLQN